MKKVLIVAVGLLFFSGCAGTGYHAVGFTGGYTDVKIQDGIFRVSFRGNSFISKDKVQNLALLRSAEVALENGYSYFVVLEGESGTNQVLYTTPMTSRTYGTVNTYGSSGTYQGNTTYSGGQTYSFNKPQTILMIKGFKEKPEVSSSIIYDAEQIKTNLKKQYKIK